MKSRAHFVPRALLLALTLTATSAAQTAPPAPNPALTALLARAKSLELPTPHVPPPGDPLEHNTVGYAKILCSAVFITGLDPTFAAENVGYFTSPYADRAKVGPPVIDREKKEVRIALPGGKIITAKYLGDQGCVTLPPGQDTVNFTPVTVKPQLPDAATQPWPMGDVLPTAPFPREIDQAKVQRALAAAFSNPAGLTAGIVVTWKGRLLGERYAPGIDRHTRLESWSMGKSVTATLLGLLVKQGVYSLAQPAPIPEWQGPADPRAKITIADLLHMSSGRRDCSRDPAVRGSAGRSTWGGGRRS